jgi:hypothetical protein
VLPNIPVFVIPAKAGIQCLPTRNRKALDPGFRRDDEQRESVIE